MNTASLLSRKLNVEALEERVLLAGSITFVGIQFVPGLGQTAVFVGSGTDVELTIENDGVGNYVLTGAPGTTLNVGAFSGSTFTTSAAQTAAVNGGVAVAFDFSTNTASTLNVGSGVLDVNFQSDMGIRGGVGIDTVNIIGDSQIAGNLITDLGLGNDVVDMSDGAFPDATAVGGNATLGLGDGDNTVTLGQDIDGNLTVTAGNGSDTVLGETNGDLEGNATLNLGSGTNTVTLMGSFEANADLTVNSDGGSDTVTLSDSADVDGNLTLNLGEGTNTVNLINSSGVDGDLTVTSGSGADTVTLSDSAFVGGALGLMLGDGINSVLLEDSTSAFDLNVMTGTGSDSVLITDTAVVTNNVNASLGAGVDDFDLLGTATIGGNLMLDTGAGDDLANFLAAGTSIFGSTNINLGTGNDGLIIDGFHGGDVTIMGGLGDDVVDSIGGVFGGDLTIISTPDDDFVTLNGITVTSDLSISVGADDDQVFLFGGSFIGGDVSIDLGSSDVLGDDLFLDSTTIGGDLTVSHAGNSHGSGLDISFTSVGGDFTFTGDGGVTDLDIAFVTVTGDTDVSTGAQNDQIDIIGSSIGTAGSTNTFDMGADNDMLTLDAATVVTGDTLLDGGSGVDTLVDLAIYVGTRNEVNFEL
ncbi:hypothetical protein [Maioricimonas sp. JC845]|uniref:beta strand repeat-containing protein n=1 Tax=Maioricimonas sp. JC845 TaxID=3232138 RepID=UPI00345ADBDB